MRTTLGVLTLAAGACLAAATTASAQIRTFDSLRGDPSAPGPIVRDAPYSGEGVTTVRTILYDGTRIERTVTAKLYRDSAGRIRREQTVMGLAELDPTLDTAQIVTIVDPVAKVVWTLNPTARTAYRISSPASRFATPPPPPPPPPPPGAGNAGVGNARPGTPAPPTLPKAVEESLGTRNLEGLTANGVKSTLTIPIGQIGNDRPIEIVEERWESPELRLLLYSRRRDPRSSDVEYRMSNITRAEPDPGLFTVPSDYTVIAPPPPPPPPAPPAPIAP